MTGVCSCPMMGWQRHRDAAPHRLARLSRCSDLSLGNAKALVRAGEEDSTSSNPQHPVSSKGCPAPYLLPARATCPREARGALLALLAPRPLQAETQIDTGQEGELRPQHGHGMATARPQ